MISCLDYLMHSAIKDNNQTYKKEKIGALMLSTGGNDEKMQVSQEALP